MSLLTGIKVRNFRCFRDEIDISLTECNYFVGANNAGKTAVLNAINYFFDNSLYTDETFLNKTEYIAKKEGYNRCDITVKFDLTKLTSVELKRRLIKHFNDDIAVVRKSVVFSPIARRFTYAYRANGVVYDSFESLDVDIKKMINSVAVTYIHPQEGKQLLDNAQDKLKQRLLANWGRNPRLSHSIRDLQEKWEDLSGQAQSYLSSSITDNIQKMWPGSSISIDLPKDIKDIVAISDITFQGSSILPEVELTSQGTGAQSSVLYTAHYLLDSDRSLHRGEYHPIWLLEEPESFLHADLVTKFGLEINSEAWLANMQIFIATHSPLMLATSRSGENKATWNLLRNYNIQKTKKVEEWKAEEIEDIGRIMGDLNFHVYFSVLKNTKSVFIEDSKPIVKNVFEQAGIPVEQGLRGVTEIKRYLDVLGNSPTMISQPIFFIVDGDQGLKDLTSYLGKGPIAQKNGFKKYKASRADDVYIIVLPEGQAAEDLFSEFELHLDNCIDELWDAESWKSKDTIPSRLTRVHGQIKNKVIVSKDEARLSIKNHQEVKDSFWQRVEKQNHSISKQAAGSIKGLLNGA